MREPKLSVPWPVLLFAASVAAWERLVAGEASTLALWILVLWVACRLVAWLWHRFLDVPKFRAGSVSPLQLFTAAFRRFERP